MLELGVASRLVPRSFWSCACYQRDAKTHRTPKHCVRNSQETGFLFRAAFGVRTRARAALSYIELHQGLYVTIEWEYALNDGGIRTNHKEQR